jgi:hypothetical protein
MKNKQIIGKNSAVHEYKGSLKNGKRDGFGKLLIFKCTSQPTNLPFENIDKLGIRLLNFNDYLKSYWDKNGNLVINKNKDNYLIYFKGYFKNNLPHGKNTLIVNRVKYKGNFKKGKFDGYGELITKSFSYDYDKASYIGYFKNNYPNGKGKFLKGQISFKSEEGNFINGKLNGKSKITWANSEYNGMVKDGYQNGKGNLVFFKTGDKWVGYWKKGDFVKGKIYTAKTKKWSNLKGFF